MKNVLFRVVIITAIVAGVIGTSTAFFSDTETSTENVLSAGAIDLQIDNTSYYNNASSSATSWALSDLTIQKFFDFQDIKPGDIGEDTISIHVNTNDAWVCADVKLTSNEENTRNEPEIVAGDVTEGAGQGELASRVNFIWWADDGDNVLEVGETVLPGGPIGALAIGQTATVRLADSTGSIWGGGALPGNSTKYIGKAWCFGAMTQAPLTQDGLGANSPRTPANSTGGITCDGTNESNVTQTDTLTADISFSAVQSRHNGNFVCGPTVTPTPTMTPTPTPIACSEAWASTVFSSSQGVRKNGTAVLVDRTDPLDALVAESTGASFDTPVLAGTFFSLGFKNNGTTPGGEVIVGFSAPIQNGPGPDLRVYEITGGPPYPDEKVKVEASANSGGPWTTLSASLTKDGTVDLGALTSAQYVRLTDVSDIAIFETTADAYDVDGVKALCAQPQ